MTPLSSPGCHRSAAREAVTIGGYRTQVGVETPGSGEVEAFEAVFAACFWPVVAYGMRRGLQEATARDVAADALTVAWRRRRDIPPDAALPWLYATAAKLVANEHRRARRATGLHLRLATDAATDGLVAPDDPAAAVDAADRLTEVGRALRRLSAADRELLLLHTWEGLTGADLGVAVGCSANTAATRLRRARHRLAQHLPDPPPPWPRPNPSRDPGRTTTPTPPPTCEELS